eukprot:6541386-Karenia_brevis.AAC.1
MKKALAITIANGSVGRNTCLWKKLSGYLQFADGAFGTKFTSHLTHEQFHSIEKWNFGLQHLLDRV